MTPAKTAARTTTPPVPTDWPPSVVVAALALVDSGLVPIPAGVEDAEAWVVEDGDLEKVPAVAADLVDVGAVEGTVELTGPSGTAGTAVVPVADGTPETAGVPGAPPSIR